MWQSIDEDMIDLEIQLVRQNPACLLVLLAYQATFDQLREESATAEAPASDFDSLETAEDFEDDEDRDSEQAPSRRAQSWIARLPSVPGVDDEELSWVHGQLIAYGLLKCDLRDRSAGVVYQLTPEARQILELESSDELYEAA